MFYEMCIILGTAFEKKNYKPDHVDERRVNNERIE
jgi:hypothetical protein